MEPAQPSLRQIVGALSFLSQDELIQLYGLTNDLKLGLHETMRQKPHSETPLTQTIEIAPNEIIGVPVQFELVREALDRFSAPELDILNSLIGCRLNGTPYPNYLVVSETTGGPFGYRGSHMSGFSGASGHNLSEPDIELFKKCVHLMGEASQAKAQGDEQKLTAILEQITLEFEKVRGSIPVTLRLMLEQFTK